MLWVLDAADTGTLSASAVAASSPGKPPRSKIGFRTPPKFAGNLPRPSILQKSSRGVKWIPSFPHKYHCAQWHILFESLELCENPVGRTPWSARVPLDPLFV